MTPEQKSAFVMARAAHMNARIAGMTAENQRDVSRGLTPRFQQGDFSALEIEFADLTHSALIGFFHD